MFINYAQRIESPVSLTSVEVNGIVVIVARGSVIKDKTKIMTIFVNLNKIDNKKSA